MAYIYICDPCQEANHSSCEKRKVPENTQVDTVSFSAGFCVCPCRHGQYLDVPSIKTTADAFNYVYENSDRYEVPPTN